MLPAANARSRYDLCNRHCNLAVGPTNLEVWVGGGVSLGFLRRSGDFRLCYTAVFSTHSKCFDFIEGDFFAKRQAPGLWRIVGVHTYAFHQDQSQHLLFLCFILHVCPNSRGYRGSSNGSVACVRYQGVTPGATTYLTRCKLLRCQ